MEEMADDEYIYYNNCAPFPRVFIWSVSATAPPTAEVPFPLEPFDIIHTGHHANIFSVKSFHHANTPTIVTCAGDGQVRVFNLARMRRSAGTATELGDLDGSSSAGMPDAPG